jgi:hypothetical protein
MAITIDLRTIDRHSLASVGTPRHGADAEAARACTPFHQLIARAPLYEAFGAA